MMMAPNIPAPITKAMIDVRVKVRFLNSVKGRMGSTARPSQITNISDTRVPPMIAMSVRDSVQPFSGPRTESPIKRAVTAMTRRKAPK